MIDKCAELNTGVEIVLEYDPFGFKQSEHSNYIYF